MTDSNTYARDRRFWIVLGRAILIGVTPERAPSDSHRSFDSGPTSCGRISLTSDECKGQRAVSAMLLAVLSVELGAVATVPAAIAVLTAYVVTEGLGWFGLPVDATTVDIDDVDVQSQLFDVTAEPLDE